MAFRHSFCKILSHPSHLPTWFFIIGYPIFWLEMYVFKARNGVTTPVALILFILISIPLFLQVFKKIKFWQESFIQFWCSLNFLNKILLVMGISLSIGILLIVLMAGFLPIHLIQESDCMQYHYALPRQHLILGSFSHIPWAADDLFLLPIDFALSPFWFVTVLPNKIPQVIIFYGFITVIFRLVFYNATQNRPWVLIAAVFSVLGFHGLGIQMGTGMLDLTIAYLFFAALDSMREGKWFFAAVEFTFFFWSKPLMPLQVVGVAILFVLILCITKYFKCSVVQEFKFIEWRKSLLVFILLSLVVGGPFVLKSIDYAATPFFPLAPGVTGTFPKIKSNPQSWASLQQASDIWMFRIKDGYGHGRSFKAFIKHWWLLAVPENGVNNAFDYPMGLPYLILIFPFMINFAKDIFNRKICLFTLLVVISWGLWWFGVQQARFLYIPVVLMCILSLIRYVKISQYLIICLTIALALNFISLSRAHKKDLSLPIYKVFNDEDKDLIMMSLVYQKKHFSGQINWNDHKIAYAQFPVRVIQERLPHTIKF